ncbi:zf-HC2 domain-containing protein [Streptomyces sp. NPDC006367]|uniref:anti-sigma factor family protein n=1 Tax=unclassified Streptomyces TaxID=2593676 RepID=UPI00339EE804
MSGSRPEPEGHLAEQHLGDRLSALVDGELGHDARERVLAHVATCPKCKAEVDAQRRLKNVFAEAPPPAPSESFLARLQGLPAGGGTDGTDRSGSPSADGHFSDGMPGMPGKFEFGYVPARPHSSPLPSSPANRGFRIHDVSRHEAERSSSRGMRFAFAAAGAVSLAAIALGGVTLGAPDTTAEARGSGTGSNVTPMRTQGTGATAGPEGQRRRPAGPLLGQAQGRRTLGDTAVAPTEAPAPLLPGLPAPAAADPSRQAVRTLTAPVMAGAAAVSPLIRPLDAPLDAIPPLAPATWPVLSEVRPPGLLAGTVSDPFASPRASASHRPAP